MDWLKEQIQQRQENDDRLLRGSLDDLAFTISKNRKYSADPTQSDEAAARAMEAIFRYFGVKPPSGALKGTTLEQKLEYALRDSGVMKRAVRLKEEWYEDAAGPIFAVNRDGMPAALMPNRVSGYSVDMGPGRKRRRVTRENAGDFAEDAFCFYRPLPDRKLTGKDVNTFLIRAAHRDDIFLVAFTALFITAVGTFTPIATKVIFQNIIPGQRGGALGAIVLFLLCMQLSSCLMQRPRSSAESELEGRLNVSFSAAMMGRLLRLPPQFFNKYNIGTISGMMEAAEDYGTAFVSAVFALGTSALFLVIYMLQIVLMERTLALPALGILTAQLILVAVSCAADRREARRSVEYRKKVIANTFALVSGIQKIKLAAAEKRAFARWLVLFRDYIRTQYKKSSFLVVARPLNTFIGLVGTALLFFAAESSGTSVAEYMAFAASFGILTQAVDALLAEEPVFSQLALYRDTFRPILTEVPEENGGQQTDVKLTGAIEVSNVSFRYGENDSYVLEKFSLNIKKGEYVGIVGRTGCGKSTLVKLLLGFLKPQQGSIFYDGKDMEKLNKTALRRRIGVILQDSALVLGDIYSNIALSSGTLSLDDAWAAAETANVAEDIRRMPMGMHTIVTEGSGGFSGGQKQRILIARAVASKPNILIFDEATSALDNITQNKVVKALDEMHCTRIVIAHRLSTIRKCDRILVLDGGKIAEQGTYEELLAKDGIFRELMEKQRI